VASGTMSPAAKLNAPHHTCVSPPAPASTHTRWTWPASGCCSVRTTRAVTTPGTEPPRESIPSTASPSAVRASDTRATASASAGSPKSPYSLSQDKRIFMTRASELGDEADVVGVHFADVADLVAHQRHPVDAEPE